MANVSQVYEIVNSVAQQAMGQTNIEVTNVQTLMALGDEVLSSDTNTNAFLNALTNRIGRTIVSIRAYNPEIGNVVRHMFEFGLTLQKIYVDLPDTQTNNTWNIGEPSYTPEFAPVTVPTVKQHLFSNLTTFAINVTIPDNLLRTAFTSAKDMALMIDAIFIAQDSRIALAIENCIQLVRAGFIARKLMSNLPCGSINLLTSYNAVMNQNLTANNALTNPDFLRWSSVQIRLWRKRMHHMSTLFNDEGYKRHTPESDAVLVLHAEYESALVSYLQSNTYHDELVAMDNYTSVCYWQGSGETFSFAQTSQIDIQLDENTTVQQSGIIAFLHDYQALGIMMDTQRVVAERNNLDEYTTYSSKVNRGYFNDMSENGMVFYIADTDFSPSNANASTTSTIARSKAK